MEAAGWSVTLAGPHAVPESLAFLPGSERWQVWKQAPRTYDVIVLTDCPNDERTEGLLAAARTPDSAVLNIDHHPDNRRYGTVNWIDPTAAATGEMVYDLIRALDLPVTPAIAINLFTAIHTDTGSFRYSNTTARTFRIAGELTAARRRARAGLRLALPAAPRGCPRHARGRASPRASERRWPRGMARGSPRARLGRLRVGGGSGDLSAVDRRRQGRGAPARGRGRASSR